MPEQKLLDELSRLQDHEEYAQKLKNMLGELMLSDNNAEIIENSLDGLEEAISERIIEVDQQIERAGNKSMDRFIRREIQ